jgi:hypothetical protein
MTERISMLIENLIAALRQGVGCPPAKVLQPVRIASGPVRRRANR